MAAGSDYVIVGAGSAGCVLANRLSEDPGTSVTLIEAGPRDGAKEIRIPAAFSKLFKSKYDWGYETTPQAGLDGRRIYFPRGKVLGGSSAMNAMMWIPGDRADFDAWPEGWHWEQMQPYLRRVEDEACSITPQADPNPMSRAFLESASETGVAGAGNLRPESLEGANLVRVTQRRGLRFSAADNYLKPVRSRKNLTVLTDCQATGIAFEGGRATRVRYRGGDGEGSVMVRREAILSAGAIGSPQILMASGIGPAEHLREVGVQVVEDLPDVGQGLQDHCMAITLYDAGGKESLYAAESPKQLLRLVLRRRGMLTSNVGEAAAFVRTSGERDAPNLELIFAPVLYVKEGLEPPPAHGFGIAAVCLQPRARLGPTSLSRSGGCSGDRSGIPPGRRRRGRPRRGHQDGAYDRRGQLSGPLVRGRASAGHRRPRRRGDRGLDPCQRAHHLPPGRHLRDGTGGRYRVACPGGRRSTGRGRLGDAESGPWSHTRADHDDRRARVGPDQGPELTDDQRRRKSATTTATATRPTRIQTCHSP